MKAFWIQLPKPETSQHSLQDDKLVTLKKTHTNRRALLRPGITRLLSTSCMQTLIKNQAGPKGYSRQKTSLVLYRGRLKRVQLYRTLSSLIISRTRKSDVDHVKDLKLLDQDKKSLTIYYEALDRANWPSKPLFSITQGIGKLLTVGGRCNYMHQFEKLAD